MYKCNNFNMYFNYIGTNKINVYILILYIIYYTFSYFELLVKLLCLLFNITVLFAPKAAKHVTIYLKFLTINHRHHHRL